MVLAGCSILVVPAAALDVATNSVGMEVVVIPAGNFIMGQQEGGDWDESPAHKVTITRPFGMSVSEVTLAQFRQSQPQHASCVNGKATDVSWHDAVAFCQWLSQRERKPYRLPTEAEWEYACRAGTTSRFWCGDQPPVDAHAANPWGLKGLHDSVLEWCFDWYGPYTPDPQTDPVGPAMGMTKVLRGGKPDNDERIRDEKGRQPDDYHRSANRAGLPPSFGSAPPSGGYAKASSGDVGIGFRVVQAPALTTKPAPTSVPFLRQGVKRPLDLVRQAPDPKRPYFRKRYLLPIPPDNSSDEDILVTGFPHAFRYHNHSPGFEVCPNGDLLLVIYTSYREYEPGVSLMAARLRFGSDQWEMPESTFDCPDANDHAPMLWTDWERGGRMYFFWGSPQLAVPGFPFQWMTSDDSGATWSEVHFPKFVSEIGPHSRQPINTALRDRTGTLYVSSDGVGGTSVLWASPDNGRTWFDTGGRSAGRHTTYCLLQDGRILGMGGKNTDIDGHMPRAISSDGGKTWLVSKTPFAALGANQRPSLLRLHSGRLFFAGDFQHRTGRKPPDIKESGSYVALSEDEGATWHIKRIPVAQPHEKQDQPAPTIGYSVARQAPNGMIHLITTMNTPCLHFELNEAWILSDADARATDADLMPPRTKSIVRVETHSEKHPNGLTKATWQAGVGDDGRFLLHGTETWYFETGSKHYEVTYQLGRKTGHEILWRKDGSVEWEWKHAADGSSQWTQYWENGTKKAESRWRNFHAEGPARRWDRDGKLISAATFRHGQREEKPSNSN